jgi:LCP family protein required for cell wall assembly
MPPAGDHSAGTVRADDSGAQPPLLDELGAREPGDRGEWGNRSRWRRARKVILILSAVVVVLVVGTASAAYLITNHYLSSMKRIHNPFASIPAAERPPRAAGPAGNDVTFIAGGRGAYVVSIPRDSWVPIPGNGDGKVNWAYYFGGPTLAVRTVEKLTGVRVDHVAIIDWEGFRHVTNALGGVTVHIPATSYDPANRITWTAGTHHLDGAQALLYVRDRYGLTSGDFDRERRQQYFLRAVFTQLRHEGKPTNPLQTSSVLRALSQAVSVDSTLSNGQITSLALSLRRMNLSSVVFATVPNAGTVSVGSQSVVLLNKRIDPGFWHAFEYDNLPAYMRGHGLKGLGASTP